MDGTAQGIHSGRSGGGGKAIERFMTVIGYPDRMSDGGALSTLRVDGIEVLAEEMDGRLVISCVLTDSESMLPTLAGYAAGRMLREDAAFTWDPRGHAVLWQDAAANSDARELTRLFETFMNSCDWWRARVDALRGEGEPMPETMVIRP